MTFRRTTCPQCRKKFTAEEKAARRLIHPECIEAYAEAEEARSERKKAKELRAQLRVERAADRKKRESLKPRAKWLAEAQAEVNRYVRLRDAKLGCCSCDLPASWGGQWHASHLRSVGAASAIRFHLWNITKSCSVCNNHKSGNIGEYLPRHIARIGKERVDWLYSQNQITTYSVEYLRRLKAVFAKKARRLERRYEV